MTTDAMTLSMNEIKIDPKLIHNRVFGSLSSNNGDSMNRFQTKSFAAQTFLNK